MNAAIAGLIGMLAMMPLVAGYVNATSRAVNQMSATSNAIFCEFDAVGAQAFHQIRESEQLSFTPPSETACASRKEFIGTR